MYDCQTDVGYRYSIDEEALMGIFEKPSAEAHIQTFHLCICHLQDAELMKRVFISFLKKIFLTFLDYNNIYHFSFNLLVSSSPLFKVSSICYC